MALTVTASSSTNNVVLHVLGMNNTAVVSLPEVKANIDFHVSQTDWKSDLLVLTL